MRPKSIALLLMSLGCGLVATVGITEVMSRRGLPDGMAEDTQQIFVATSDIPLGDPLTPQVMKLESWPKNKIPPGALSRLEDAEGRRARTKLYSGEPILENRLLGKGASEQGATALIPKGYRVVPVQVDLVSGGSAMILPGDRVDVMVHSVKDPSREIPETITQTILQDIKVFAVDNVLDLEKDKDNNTKSIAAKTISLLVTPEQAALVMMASRLGSINLVMRSPEDDEQGPNPRVRPGELFDAGKKSDRAKETLLAPGENNLPEKTNKFVEFLNSMKNGVAGQSPAPEATTPRHTFAMRVIKPGEVNEVQFEKAENVAATEWKPTGSVGSPAISASTEETKAAVPQVRDGNPLAPLPPKPEPKKGRKP